MREFKNIARTAGDGYWSGVAKTVKITGLDIGYLNQEGDFGELRVYFDRRTWNTGVHGLIYTDKGFMNDFRAALMAAGFSKAAVNDITYSEQGLQRDDYVSCDAGEKFLNEWFMEKVAA